MAEPLGRLLTDLGERTDYDAVSQCSRCGYCEAACPTYVATGREAFSPRGRNQLLRLTLEGKLEDPSAAEEALSTCLLCGACTTACYAKVAVPDLVLEGRRGLRRDTHWLVRRVSRLLIEDPRALARLLKLGFLLKRLGLSRLGRPVLRALGLGPLAAMDEHSDEAPLRLLDDELPALRAAGEGDAWGYFAPCGPRYLLPRVGRATWRALTELKGRGRFLENSCCGLLAHNYGRLADAREFARRNIVRYEELKEKFGSFRVVADCSSCAAFMKSYEQLFTADPDWRPRAKAFAEAVSDVLEFIPPDKAGEPASGASAGPVTYHDSCRACHGQGIRRQPREVLRKLAGKSYRELPESDWCCGGAGAFAFTQPELSARVLDRKLRNIASVQAATVVVGAASCLAQIGAGLRKCYPSARAVHYSVFLDEASNK